MTAAAGPATIVRRRPPAAVRRKRLLISIANHSVLIAVAVAFLAITFITAVLLLFWHYRLVRGELEAREMAESQAREAEQKARASESVAVASNEAARRLSGRLMSLQDEERRRLSRDLHDSTGQYLAAAKMVLSPLAAAHDWVYRSDEANAALIAATRDRADRILSRPGAGG